MLSLSKRCTDCLPACFINSTVVAASSSISPCPGLEAVKQALAAGHTVTALVRSPEKLAALAHEQLTVTKCDVMDQEQLAPHLQGCGAVLSCLGFKPEKPAVTGYLAVTKSMVAAMDTAGVDRLVVCHSWWGCRQG